MADPPVPSTTLVGDDLNPEVTVAPNTIVPNPLEDTVPTTTVPAGENIGVTPDQIQENTDRITNLEQQIVPSRIIQAPHDELQKILLAGRSPNDVMNTMINILLDNYIYFVQFTGAPPLPADSIYASVDAIGLSGQFGALTSAIGQEGKVPYTVEVMRLSDPTTRGLIRDFEAKGMFGEDYAGYDTLETEQQVRLDNFIDNKYKGHEFMFLAPAVDEDGRRPLFKDPTLGEDQVPMIGIFPTYDGTNMGNISNIEEMMAGMPLDRQSIEFFLPNLAAEDPAKFRAIQSQMSMLGFYPAGEGGQARAPAYGSYTDTDKMAFFNFTSAIMNEHIRVVEHNRKNPTAQLPSTEVNDFLDERHATIISETTKRSQQPITDSSGNIIALTPSQGLHTEVTQAVEDLINERWNPFGKSVNSNQRETINQMMNTMAAEGDIDLTNITNENITGVASSDEQLALADAFGAEFYGGHDAWATNISLGVSGTAREFARLANEAGVQYDFENPTDSQKQNTYRWYFITLLNKNNGDFDRTANEFANTFGAQQLRKMESVLVGPTGQSNPANFLSNAITNATKTGSFGSFVGANTLEEQGEERLQGIQTLANRVDKAVNFREPKDDAREQIMGSLLTSLRGSGNQRRARG